MENGVNWEEQWALFAENFYDGQAHINLSRFGKDCILRLLPGPGFGDLSHPTTSLMLEMMHPHLQNESIVDIGSGSGILALSALLLGAKSALGIDIDPLAIIHAKKNNRLNGLQAQFRKTLPKTLLCQEGHVFLMNMILSEQKTVSPQKFNKISKLWIVSGVLASQKKQYLEQTKEWGWTLLTEKEKSDWACFAFKPSSDP